MSAYTVCHIVRFSPQQWNTHSQPFPQVTIATYTRAPIHSHDYAQSSVRDSQKNQINAFNNLHMRCKVSVCTELGQSDDDSDVL